MLRGNRVFARCDASGALVQEGGRVEVRYRQGDGKAYRAAKANLNVETTGPIFPDEHCGEASPVREQKGARKKGAAKTGAAPSNLPTLEDGAAIAYTDGACSKNPGPCGVGVVLKRGESTRELSEYLGTGTNNIAELTAILRALEVHTADVPLVVHTDSQYAIGVLTKGWKPKANQELIARIKEVLKLSGDVRFVYVPGHAGVPLNERADALARASVEARHSAGWQDAGGRS